MSLLLRVNLVIAPVCAVALLVLGWVYRSSLEVDAKREVLTEAGLMADSALAIRAYTANEIDPLLQRQIQNEFLPQSVPFYAATENFLKLRETHPQYAYKEATLNPTNPRDRAADWEADIIQRFRNEPQAHQVVGERDTPVGRSLYLARPIRAERECLECHSLASTAPRAVVARYGSSNGFGWQAGEVIGAQVVSVPFASAEEHASRAFRAVMLWVAGAFLITWAAVNLALYAMVLRPLQAIAQGADRLSVGERAAAQFPSRGAREIVVLAEAFERLRKSLDKALRMLEP
jgi:HAMP domain-containing protein